MDVKSIGTMNKEWFALAVVTGLAVVFDASVVPFYPTIFAESFGMHSASVVGRYLSMTCLVAMLSFLGWGWLERRVATLPLVMVGQIGAMLLSIACARTESVEAFWWISLGMIACKSSYLLVYPYLLRVTDAEFHGRTIGVLTVVVHVGGVVGATMGGALLTVVYPQSIYYLLASGDVMQFGVCLWLVMLKSPVPVANLSTSDGDLPWRTITGLGLCMLLFYLGLFGVRPFFVQYWIDVSGWDNLVIAGLVFSIPAWMSLLGLVLRYAEVKRPLRWIFICLVGAGALSLQMVPRVEVVLLGRCIFGFVVFLALVRLDVIAFGLVSQKSYTRVFGVINIYQQLGALISFYLAGELVSLIDMKAPFMMAIIAFVGSWVVFYATFNLGRNEKVVVC